MCFSSSNFVSGLFLFLNMKYEQSFYFDKKDKEKNSVSSTRLMCHKVCIQAKRKPLAGVGDRPICYSLAITWIFSCHNLFTLVHEV